MSIARSHRAPGWRTGRVLAAALGVAALALAMAAGPAGADAAMYRGNSGLTGAYADQIAPPLALYWKYTSTYSGYNPSSPAVVDGTAYFASGNRLYAVSGDTGALKWRYPQDEPMSTAVNTSLAVDDGVVLFGAGDGKLYAIHADTGKYAWAFDTRSSVGASPTVADGVAYFGSSDGRIWAVDIKTGTAVLSWKNGVQLTDEITSAPAVANGMVYALSADQQIHAIGSATGKERFVNRVGGSVLRMSPVVSGDYVYVGAGQNLYCLMGRNLVQKWMLPLTSDMVTTPTVSDAGVFVVCSDNRVRCFDPRTGKQKWPEAKLPKLDYDVVAAPAISGNTLFVGTVEGGIYALDTDTGAIRWSYTIQPSTRDVAASSSTSSTSSGNTQTGVPAVTNVAAAPVIANNALFVLSDDGSLSCFRPDATDTSPPTVTDLEPDAGVVVNGAPPIHFQAKIHDEGSGVDPASVKVLIDEQGVAKRPEGEDNEDKPGFKFDRITDTLEYDTPIPVGAGTVRPLSEGRHTVTVVAMDWKGNTVTKSWSFTVDNSVAKVARRRPGTTTGMGPGRGAGGTVGPGGMGSGSMGPGGMMGPGGRGGVPGGRGGRRGG